MPPFLEGTTLTGRGVVRTSPWHFVGIYKTKDEAAAEAASRGDGYIVRYGDNQEFTDNFIWDSVSNPDTP